MDDFREKVQASASGFERLVLQIPGFGGYKAKEQRREADKLLRLHVARQYEAQLTRLNSLQTDLAAQGDLKTVLALERAAMKLQLLIDRIKTASYGYAGLFDAVKVDDAALDRLYAFDESLLEGANRLGALLDRVAGALAIEQVPTAEVKELVALLEELHTTFSRRQDVIVG